MNAVDFFFARDARITYAITGYVVRTAPFYSPTGGGNLLDLFRAEWNTNQTGLQRDIAHLMTGKPGNLHTGQRHMAASHHIGSIPEHGSFCPVHHYRIPHSSKRSLRP